MYIFLLGLQLAVSEGVILKVNFYLSQHILGISAVKFPKKSWRKQFQLFLLFLLLLLLLLLVACLAIKVAGRRSKIIFT